MNNQNRRRLGFIIIIMIIVLIVTCISLDLKSQAYSRDINVSRDAYVYETYPNSNYGLHNDIYVGNYNYSKTEAYYCFNVSSLPNGWTWARIVVYFDSALGAVDVGINLTSDSWDELSITWNNKPNQGEYRGNVLYDDRFNIIRIPLRSEDLTTTEISICLYGRGGDTDGYIQGNSKEGASNGQGTPYIRLFYDKYDQFIGSILVGVTLFLIVFFLFIGLEVKEANKKQKSMNLDEIKEIKRILKISESYSRRLEKFKIIEKEINPYITLKLEHRRTFIYVNGKRFIQCIRLILNIPKIDVPLYDEIDSIDEAAKMYSNHIHKNRIIRGAMAFPEPNQHHNITPEQEFWGHCSNIQAWIEHDYDTRILMSNISFPLLRELTKAGDLKARRVYKEEIALRLESGYPSVVQYLLTQGYIQVFSPSEFKTILESTDLIKNFSSEPKILSQFLRSCILKFPTLLEDILLQILKLPDGKNIFFSSIQNKT